MVLKINSPENQLIRIGKEGNLILMVADFTHLFQFVCQSHRNENATFLVNNLNPLHQFSRGDLGQ